MRESKFPDAQIVRIVCKRRRVCPLVARDDALLEEKD